MAAISIYKNIHDVNSKQTVDLSVFLDAIQSGKWQDQVLKVRTIKDHDERQQAKKSLPYVTISGIFSENRSVKGLSAHSGFISMDLDNLGSEVEGVRQLLSKDPYVFACFTSCSGTGLCALFKIDPEKHREAFDGIADYLIKTYQLIVDPSGKDVSRPRYVSYDPDLFHNPSSLTFKKYLPKPKAKKITSTIFVQDEFDRVINEMVAANISCVEDYRDWRDIGFGLADQFGEAGRRYYHLLSSCSAKYEQSMCDRQYTHCLRGNGQAGSKITIATIYWYAKQAGIQVHGEKTKRIAAATSTMKKAGMDAKAIAENLRKFEGIQDAESIISQAFAANTSFQSGETLVDNIRMWLRHNYSLKRNVITRKLENNGKILDEIDLNTMFLDALVIFDKLTFDLFCKVLFSSNTPQYNPILDFLTDNIDRKPSGAIDAFFSAFNTDGDIAYFGKKWLVSVVASAHGTHSPLMLILAGERQGTGKTEAFRRLLPEPLRPYYAESKLDAGKDDEILMTQKLIIMDDEMGGKSKKESKRLKELTSKQTFTLREPYGKMNVDLTRLAVLCGTTNDLEILNDPTGNRRLLPFEIYSIDFDKYNAVDKCDVFMEAYHLYKAGFQWELSSADIDRLSSGTEKFNETSMEYETIHKFFIADALHFMTTTEIKNRMETLTVQKFNIRKIGMELKRMKVLRGKENGIYGYRIRERRPEDPLEGDKSDKLPF